MTLPCALRRWATAFAEEVRAGRVDFLEVVRMAAEELEGSLEVCPSCARRPIRPQTPAGRDGQCLTCHLRHLAEAHREMLSAIEARQEVDRDKQLVHRRRRTMGDDLPPELAAGARASGRRRTLAAAFPAAATESGDGGATMAADLPTHARKDRDDAKPTEREPESSTAEPAGAP